jgi:hypothetical protein
MDPDKKRILQKEIADYSKTVFNRIYDKIKIEDVAVKIHPLRLGKNKETLTGFFMFPMQADIGYISYLIKLGIDKEDVSNPLLTTWEQLYDDYDLDVAYMARNIIPDQILHNFFNTYSDVLLDNIILSDKNGNVIYKYEI